ncbi:hypothetical protein TrST_g5438 [Triparma strigata]|uniref:Tyrosine-protein kinase ephrin type A/B receptor-like domain-containing protein n=1 Tax=Triparma strigata TaxID=1606541 RepID=A0A9W7E9W8_9STRA|nr:hypothetical protein TrST_g5438 [Triparma strigata]
MDCASGKFSPAGASICTSCDAGKHSSSSGSSEDICVDCDAGTFSEQGRSSDGSCEKCVIGKAASAGFCEDCPLGSYAPGEGFAVCLPCPPNQFPKEDQTGCEVITGYYTDGVEGQSIPIPTGVSETATGMTLEALEILPGYWRTSSTSKEILACLNSIHCKWGVDTTDLCAEGYTGPLCAVCASGFAAVGVGESLTCNVCNTGSEAAVSIAVAIVLLIFTAVLACYLNKGFGEDVQSLLRQRSLASSEAVNSVAQKFEKYQPIIKIIFTYFQVVGSLGFLYGLNFPPIFSTATSIFGGIFSLDFISIMPLGCIAPADFYVKLVVYTALPLILGAILIVWYTILSSSSSPERQNLKVKVFQVFLALTFIVLPSVSVKIFSTFACHTFDGDYGSYLKADFSLDCTTDTHKFHMFYAAFMVICYPVGIPLMYFLLLYEKRDKLDPG